MLNIVEIYESSSFGGSQETGYVDKEGQETRIGSVWICSVAMRWRFTFLLQIQVQTVRMMMMMMRRR